jgi:hypothetical protein
MRLILNLGGNVAQAVSSWLFTAAVRVRARARLDGICGRQRGNKAGLLRVLLFPLKTFHRLFNNHRLSSRTGTIGQ